MKASCFNCIHCDVCRLQGPLFEEMPKLLDFDKPGGSEWLTAIFELLASRCRQYKPFKHEAKEQTGQVSDTGKTGDEAI